MTMRNSKLAPWATAVYAAILCGLAAATLAEETVPIRTELVAEVREDVVVGPGRSFARYKPATAIGQGQTVFYTVRIHNPTPISVPDVVTVQKIPINTRYVPGSAAGPAAEIMFSIDGGQTFLPERQLWVTEENSAPRRALAGEYTHIRWRLRNPLAPGATALARFQAIFQ